MGVVRNLFDGLSNALTGAGTTTDPRVYNSYHARCMSDQEIDAAYRGGWVMRKIIDKPATEMVREWRDWQADAADIEKLEALERKLDLRNKVRRAETLRGLGGAGMVLWTNDRDQAQPISDSLAAGALQAVHVWHRSRFNLGPLIETWGDPWFGHPSYYEVRLSSATGNNSIKFHPSRVVPFKGKAVPDIMGSSWQDAFWGESTVATVIDAVQNSDTAQNGFAALIKDARNRRLKVPKLTERLATTADEQQFSRRVAAMALGESMFGVTFLDAGGDDGKGGETLEDRQMVWSGIPEIGAMYLAAAAGAADMPATILLGKSPDGMNATGEGDRVVWEGTIKARQDLDLRPCLDQIDAVLVPSALGKPTGKVWWQFAPLSTLSEKDEATTFKTTMEAMELVRNSGSIPPIAYEKGLQNLITERGWVPGLDAALAEVPEDERFPSEIAELKPEGGDQDLDEGGATMEAEPRRRAANDKASDEAQ